MSHEFTCDYNSWIFWQYAEFWSSLLVTSYEKRIVSKVPWEEYVKKTWLVITIWTISSKIKRKNSPYDYSTHLCEETSYNCEKKAIIVGFWAIISTLIHSTHTSISAMRKFYNQSWQPHGRNKQFHFFRNTDSIFAWDRCCQHDSRSTSYLYRSIIPKISSSNFRSNFAP